MLERGVQEVVVVDADGAVRGVVTERALTLNPRFLRTSAIKTPAAPRDDVEAACTAAQTVTVNEVMDNRLTTATVDESIGVVVDRMIRREAEYALELRNGTVIGLLGRRDLLSLVAGRPNARQAGVPKTSTVTPSSAHVPTHAGWPALGRLAQALKSAGPF